jgi:hypothetical protein
MAAQRSQHVCRPERADHVRLCPPALDSGALGQLGAEVSSLGVEAAECGLHIVELGLVLDVEEGRRVRVERDDICAAGELEVLLGLVDPDLEAECAKARGLGFTHGRVDDVCLPPIAAAPPSRVRQSDLGTKAERPGDTHVRLERGRSPDSTSWTRDLERPAILAIWRKVSRRRRRSQRIDEPSTGARRSASLESRSTWRSVCRCPLWADRIGSGDGILPCSEGDPASLDARRLPERPLFGPIWCSRGA